MGYLERLHVCKADFKACALRIICWRRRRYDHNNGLRRRCGSKSFFLLSLIIYCFLRGPFEEDEERCVNSPLPCSHEV